MEIVIDANILFAALIANKTTRKLILKSELIIYSPQFIIEEFLNHLNELENKTGLNKEILKELVNEFIIKANIVIVPKSDFESFIQKAKEISPDTDDIMYFALALKFKCPIWSNDKKLKDQNKIKIYSTEDLLKLFPS